MQFISGWVMAVIVGGVAISAAQAADDIRSPYSADDPVFVGRGPYAAMPPPGTVRGVAVDEEGIPPFEVVRIIRAMGYEPLGTPVRRRWVYTISAIDSDGYDGRVVLDAHTGRVMRFIPAEVSNDVVVGDYGMPGMPAPSQLPERKMPDPKSKRHASLRPPALIPHVANRDAAPAVKPEAHATVGVAPGQQAASSPAKPPELKAAEIKPAEAKPALQLLPTQDMPPVQGLD